MPTNLAIDDDLLEEALEIGKEKTKKDTVNHAIKEYIERRMQKDVLKLFGSTNFESKYDYKKMRSR